MKAEMIRETAGSIHLELQVMTDQPNMFYLHVFVL